MSDHRRVADHFGAVKCDRVLECEPVVLVDDIAQAFVVGSAFVGGGGCRGEPAFVDAAAMRAEGVEVLRGEFEPASRHQERPRHPCRR